MFAVYDRKQKSLFKIPLRGYKAANKQKRKQTRYLSKYQRATKKNTTTEKMKK